MRTTGSAWAVAGVCALVLLAALAQRAHTYEWFSSRRVPSTGRKTLVIYTGGTIGMQKGAHGYEPRKGYLGRQLEKILALHKRKADDIAPYEILEFDPLLDSSNMGIKDWNKMAKCVADHYHDYSAFVIVHGTDTMAYSASALSFALPGLAKPVIFTGSQIPLARARNDGQNNLIASLQLASHYDIPEVLLVFAGAIMRGNRVTKLSSNKLDAFMCPNFPDLGAFGYAQAPSLSWDLIDQKPQGSGGSFHLSPYEPRARVEVVTLTPGMDYERQADMLVSCGSPPQGIVLRTFGIGDGPTSNKHFMRLLELLNENKIVVLNVSQCLEGRVDSGDYATGSALEKKGVISGQDMTIEAGYTKLLWLLSKHKGDPSAVRRDLSVNLEGELSRSGGVFTVDPH